MVDIMKLKVSEMTGLDYECQCGRVHKVDIKNIKVGSGVIDEIPSVLSAFKGSNVLLVSDKNTYNAGGEALERATKGLFNMKKLIFSGKQLVADEKTIGRILIEADKDIALIIALGSGTINDVTRFISYRMEIPYIVVCTAPSMDGYASIVSPLIIDGVKTTYPAVYPYAIFADIEIMKNAPMHMLQAGLGDVLGKYTALCDWKMANILNGEYYCETTVKLVQNAIDRCVKAAPELSTRSTEAVWAVTEALILTGLAIGMIGNSRPASSEEHHISHFWEMAFLSENRSTSWLHGNNVGVGTGMILEIYRYLLEIDIKEIYNSGRYRSFSMERWIKNIENAYGRNAENIIAFKKDSLTMDEGKRESMMENILDKWDLLRKLFSKAPSPEEFTIIMKQAGCVYHPSDLGIDRELFRKTLIAAKDVRKRYGVLQLLEDIGILEETADKIADIYYSK